MYYYCFFVCWCRAFYFSLCISSHFFFVSFSQIMHKLSFPNGLTQVVDNVLVGLCVYCELPKEVQSSF